jgi:hypothetical protein
VSVDDYLRELAGRLPRTRRARFLAEAEAHLRDAVEHHRARGLPPLQAEAKALAEFGSVDLVARRVAAEFAVLEIRAASLVALGAAACFVIPLYVVPENTLPPATWATKPGDIVALQAATVSLWLGSVVLAACGAGFSWTRWPRLAAEALTASVVAIASAGAASAALVVRWFDAQGATSEWPLLAAPTALVCVGACVLATFFVRRQVEATRLA